MPDVFIDSHCHLDHEKFAADQEAVITRARAAGLSHLVTIGADIASSQRAVVIAQSHDDIWATVGVHPHDAAEAGADYLAELDAMGRLDRVVAIGEIGLDYHYDFSPRAVQRQRFAEQLGLAHERNLPVVIHMRTAEQDCLDILRSVGVGPRGGVMHCFTSTLEYAKKTLDLGLHISIPGVVTYKKPGELPEVVKYVPLDRMLVETDAPYLAPVPLRGKRNEPAFVVHTVDTIAQLRTCSVEEVRRATAQTAQQMFALPAIDDVTNAAVAYKIRENLYLNITNACTLSCIFCPKQHQQYAVKGHQLKLAKAPSVEEIIAACGDVTQYTEVVFVGLGESTLRLDVLKEVAAWLKGQHAHVRLDTDGLASLVHRRAVAHELRGLVDAMSISLNAADAETYARLCPSRFASQAYDAVKAFIVESRNEGFDVTASIVAVPEFDAAYIERCRNIAEHDLGVAFRVREYNNVG